MGPEKQLAFLEGLEAYLSQLELEAKVLSHSPLYGLYDSVFKDKGADFAEVRRYAFGDDVRRIDWKVTARSNQPHVRVDHEEREMPLLFVMDSSPSFLWSSLRKSKRQSCAELIGLLGTLALQKGDAPGFIQFSDHVEQYLAPKKNKQHLWNILLSCLNGLEPTQDSSLKTALGFINQLKCRQSVILVISNFKGDDWHEEMNILSLKHDVIPTMILDPRECTLKGGGQLVLHSPEHSNEIKVNLSQKELQVRFKAHHEQYLQQLRGFFSDKNIDMLIHTSNANLMDTLFAFLHHRNQSGRRRCQIL
jgi:uncharacterized protein (DUF58 family)